MRSIKLVGIALLICSCTALSKQPEKKFFQQDLEKAKIPKLVKKGPSHTVAKKGFTKKKPRERRNIKRPKRKN